jgi:hypothetical protein
MAVDLERIVGTLTDFYDFSDKTVVAVGAGGGQLAAYGRAARQIIAVDPDREALGRLVARASELGFPERVSPIADDWLNVNPHGDVVLFEFCLHLMENPGLALAHANGLAADVVVIGHAPHSPWSWCAVEERGVALAWDAATKRGVRRQIDLEAFQSFTDYSELEAKLAGQGSTSRERIEPNRGKRHFSIPMPYRIALVQNQRVSVPQEEVL